MTRLYAEETFPLRVVEELRRLGHDVLTAFEDGRANQAISQERKEILQEGKKCRIPRSVINRGRILRPQFLKEKHETDEGKAGVTLFIQMQGRYSGMIATIIRSTDLHSHYEISSTTCFVCREEMAMIAVLYKQGGKRTWNNEMTKSNPR